MSEWKTAWGHTPYDASGAGASVRNHTQRMTFENNIAGDRLRLRFFNLYGEAPLCFDEVWVESAGVKRQVTLAGESSIRLPPGQISYSDDILLPVKAGNPVIITTKQRGETPVNNCMALLYPPLNRVEVGGELILPPSFPPESMVIDFEFWWHGISDVEVFAEEPVRIFAAFGDSIVQMSYWTGPMTRELYRRHPGGISVVNRGIGGNRILSHAHPMLGIGDVFGDAGRTRFERDVFGGAAPELVMLHEGVNDLNFSRVDGRLVRAEEVTAGLREMAETARRHGAKVIGCTILPAGGHEWWNDEQEAERIKVNRWILESGVYDAAFDYAAWVADGRAPSRLAAPYDSGDGLHPNPAGGAHIAEKLDYEGIERLVFGV